MCACKNSSVSSFNTIIKVEKPVRETDYEGGQSNDNWLLRKKILGHIISVTGKETFVGQSIKTSMYLKIKTIYTKEIENTDRLEIDGSKYNIRVINKFDQMKRFMIIECESGVSY